MTSHSCQTNYCQSLTEHKLLKKRWGGVQDTHILSTVSRTSWHTHTPFWKVDGTFQNGVRWSVGGGWKIMDLWCQPKRKIVLEVEQCNNDESCIIRPCMWIQMKKVEVDVPVHHWSVSICYFIKRRSSGFQCVAKCVNFELSVIVIFYYMSHYEGLFVLL